MSSGAVVEETEELVDFGYADVPKHEKIDRVRGVFSSIAGKYDLMNDLMSFGVHRLWKRRLIGVMQPQPTQHLIDVAGGTGDIAKLFLACGGGRATLCDLTPAMLEAGRARLLDTGYSDRLQWVCAKAEAIPFSDRKFHTYSISFGLRNVTDRLQALAEAYRVLRPGGRYFCLEFSPKILPALQRLYDIYSDALLPRLGQWVAGDAESYRYLVESIRRFRDSEGLCDDLAGVGFARVRTIALSGGIVRIHQGFKP
ncbi:MAG: class I SAM-dependent methyltransferase [Alphaproteobacteria bacterium]|nr:class I SAM-dependent methyltransferase [Alphaproteobacteria bacterium]